VLGVADANANNLADPDNDSSGAKPTIPLTVASTKLARSSQRRSAIDYGL
jgi:hypothetical protein